ncbi:formate dehydrogenase subunit delta [Balneatrix alpica]|uniref:Formate dehydrogenase subunit delta n=1 Tax=Balneatrix alpica TaxID=75684 RepID=A0ABV5ZAQ3_9GAMM|nr:formate dehydrogenase subunit delta [Balneatrix alpica]
MNPEYLIKMANQIARNLGYEQDNDKRAEKVAGHIRKFWEPRMIQALLKLEPTDPQLDPCVVLALGKL